MRARRETGAFSLLTPLLLHEERCDWILVELAAQIQTLLNSPVATSIPHPECGRKQEPVLTSIVMPENTSALA
jgi:hypothetical protein